MIFIILSLSVSLVGITVFAALDARAAYDNDPNTHTLSEYIKRWARHSPAHKALLAVAIFQLCLIPLYLTLHLVLQVI